MDLRVVKTKYLHPPVREPVGETKDHHLGFLDYISRQLRQQIDRLEPPESLVLVLSAVLVGTGTGLGAVAFIWLLRRITELTLLGKVWLGNVVGVLVFMGLAGLGVGYVVDHWAREAKGHGVPEVMEAIALRSGRIRPRVAALKVLASSLTIGMGGSAGREGPIVQVGSALGSTLGQIMHFSAERVRILVACGAAGGLQQPLMRRSPEPYLRSKSFWDALLYATLAPWLSAPSLLQS